MPLWSRIPEITTNSALATQKAVELAGQEVEFHALQAAQSRRRSGDELRKIRWRPNRRDPFKGEVGAGAFYTRFSEYGTVHEPARPILGPAAEEVRDSFVSSVHAAWEHG